MASFSKKIIHWYNKHKRDLPWRNTKDPYLIWLSEIILQQTRVDQGLDYYYKFSSTFPTITTLANASNEKIMKLWQGLGYYSRARNLHFTAQFISKEYNGNFPTTHKEIISLKGVGDYTAAAIASLAFDLPYAVVDGNVYRVLSRFFGITTPIDSVKGKKEFATLADKVMDKTQPAAYNQAIMEFGALYCKPLNPDCNACIVKNECIAFKSQLVQELPVKAKKIKIRNRYFNYLVFNYKNKTLIKKRIEKDIWINLYDFPLIETDHDLPEEAFLQSKEWQNLIGSSSYIISQISPYYKHVLSHQKIFARFWEFTLSQPLKNFSEKPYILVNKKDIEDYAVPRLIENYLNKESFQ